MRIWKDDLYGNEDAQSFLSEIESVLETEELLEECLMRLHEHPDLRYPECYLVLVDFEADLTGNIRNVDEALRIIERQLDETELKSWINPLNRKTNLLDFQRKVKKTPFESDRTQKNAPWEWLREKSGV